MQNDRNGRVSGYAAWFHGPQTFTFRVISKKLKRDLRKNRKIINFEVFVLYTFLGLAVDHLNTLTSSVDVIGTKLCQIETFSSLTGCSRKYMPTTHFSYYHKNDELLPQSAAK